jgi:protein tyrosine/serine phosphatase
MIRAAVAATLVSLLLAGCGAQGLPGAGVRGMTAAQALRLKSTISAENFTKVDANLYRSGVPSDEDMAAFAGMGIKTDITLQSLSGKEAGVVAHEKAVAKKVGIKVVHLPLPWGQDPPEAMLDKYFDVFEKPENLPAIVHCKHGRDRTGTLVALYRIVKSKWTNERAFKEMGAFGFKKADYPHYHAFVMAYARQSDQKKAQKQKEAAFAAFMPGSWDQE